MGLKVLGSIPSNNKKFTVYVPQMKEKILSTLTKMKSKNI